MPALLTRTSTDPDLAVDPLDEARRSVVPAAHVHADADRASHAELVPVSSAANSAQASSLPAGHHDVGAGSRETERHLPAQPAVAAGDERATFPSRRIVGARGIAHRVSRIWARHCDL